MFKLQQINFNVTTLQALCYFQSEGKGQFSVPIDPQYIRPFLNRGKAKIETFQEDDGDTIVCYLFEL